MARKSRKETAVLPAPEIDTTCRAGVYVRLSVEDKHTRTASIETQQLIIARYLEQNPEIIVVQTYIDNGATGTNFHRPGFQQTDRPYPRCGHTAKRQIAPLSAEHQSSVWVGAASSALR